MSEQKPITVPDGWDQEACVLWESGKRFEAIKAAIERINQASGKSPRLILQAAYYLFFMNDYSSATILLENQLAITPNHFEIMANLAVCHDRQNRFADAVELGQRALKLKPDNFNVMDLLTSCLSRLKRHDEASEIGTRVLEMKNSASDKSIAHGWNLPEGSPGEYANRPGKRNVVAFSLWGDKPAYLRGALRNLLLATDLYPGWILRFNVDPTVPEAFIGLIKELGGEVVMHAGNATLRQKLCWRFQVANDPEVGYFLVRDADSVIGLREVQAVQAWLASGRWFHIMRDWWTHTDLVLAGMWGGVAGVLPDLTDILTNYHSSSAETPNIDQWFLRDRVWPFLRQSCLVQDRCFRPAGSMPFPGVTPDDNLHVGQDEYVARGALQEKLLRPWIEAYPCLGPLRFKRE